MDYYIPWVVGIERLFSDIENSNKGNTASYPPHNIVEYDEDTSVIELAVAGFNKNQIKIETRDCVLKITGESEKDERKYAYKGISTRNFIRQFTLGKYIEVEDATLSDGILRISLKRHLPEEKKPREISIS